MSCSTPRCSPRSRGRRAATSTWSSKAPSTCVVLPPSLRREHWSSRRVAIASQRSAGSSARLSASSRFSSPPSCSVKGERSTSERSASPHLALSRALTAALSVAGTRPALVDVAAASLLSERTARRAIPELAKTYGFAYTNWRTFRRAWSTVLACVLLTSPRASPAMVCRLTGFAGPASLCHALRRAGLPTPRDLQRRAQPLLST